MRAGILQALGAAVLGHCIAGSFAAASDAVVIKAGTLMTLNGDSITGGVIVVRDGRIAQIGTDVEVPDGARVIELDESVVTPGLIDACATIDFEIQTAAQRSGRRRFWAEYASLVEHYEKHVDAEENGGHLECVCGTPPMNAPSAFAAAVSPAATSAEQVSEVIPHLRIFDAVNLFASDFDRLASDGVTTVFVSPDSASVIGTRGAILKTGGALENRIVSKADAVKATIGSDPSRRGMSNFLPPWYGPSPSFLTRRPNTRMGVEFVFRKAFYDADRFARDLPLQGADSPPLAAMATLREIRSGEVPLRIQARLQNDILTALRLATEFGLQITLEEATEAWRCLPQIKAAGVPVVYGPIFARPSGWRAWSGEADNPRLTTPRMLADEGIPFALTAQELRGEDGLARQAMFATRYGLPRERALEAVTKIPAQLLGIADEVGTLESGKSADLVVWSGDPLQATSRPTLVMIGGEVVYEE